MSIFSVHFSVGRRKTIHKELIFFRPRKTIRKKNVETTDFFFRNGATLERNWCYTWTEFLFGGEFFSARKNFFRARNFFFPCSMHFKWKKFFPCSSVTPIFRFSASVTGPILWTKLRLALIVVPRAFEHLYNLTLCNRDNKSHPNSSTCRRNNIAHLWNVQISHLSWVVLFILYDCLGYCCCCFRWVSWYM